MVNMCVARRLGIGTKVLPPRLLDCAHVTFHLQAHVADASQDMQVGTSAVNSVQVQTCMGLIMCTDDNAQAKHMVRHSNMSILMWFWPVD